MNSQHLVIRALITTMAPNRAIRYIRAFNLPEDEENILIACDVQNLSHVEAARKYHMTPEVVKRRKRSAYAHIADEINNK